jgi:hypothetical protein
MKLYGFGPTRSLRALWGLKGPISFVLAVGQRVRCIQCLKFLGCQCQ